MVHVDKPSWVSHGGQPIFSIDVHPDGSRFATAGQDHQVKLWALKPVVDAEAERDESEPQLLASLGGHLGAVNCVRWSVDGALLASGSDDHLVMIWRQAATGEAAGSAPFGSRAPPPTERWRCVLTLSGHTGDVVDLSWSPAGYRLASVSLDNSVRIWSVECATAGGARLGGPQQLVTSLDGHCGMVKGVAWDPIGRYVASQGDDKAVLVWNAREWTQAARVEEPFTRTSQKTLFRRLRWSPDGQFLCAPHAYKKPAHIAAVLRRPTGVDTSAWTPEVDFVGHTSPVVVASFSPRIFTRADADGTAPAAGRAAYCVCALGGQDCVVSVWLTCKAKAACVVHGLFTEDVLDLSWASDGATLLACSMDGSVACVRLEQHEIGTPLPHAEQADRLASLYGHDHGNAAGGGGAGGPAPLPDSAQMLMLEGTSPARVTLCVPAPVPATRAPFAAPGGLGQAARGLGAEVLEACAVAGGATGRGDGGTLRCSQGGELLWSAALTSPAVLLAAGGGWSAAACADGSVVILTPAGRRAVPALHAVEAAAWLHAEGDALLLVGSRGEVRVWRGLPGAVSCAVSVSAAPILGTSAPRLHRASLLPDGSPLLCLTSGSYAWRQSLAAWLPLDDAGFVGSAYASGLVGLQGATGCAGSEHAPGMLAAEDGPAGVAARLAGMLPERQRMLTAAHIEQRMAVAAEMGAARDYTEWARLYARQLALPLADVRKVRELCDDLLGPLDEAIGAPHTAMPRDGASLEPRYGGWAGSARDGGAGLVGVGGTPGERAQAGWSPTVAGVRKLDLLQETVLPTLATNRHLQRILAEYLEMVHAMRHT